MFIYDQSPTHQNKQQPQLMTAHAQFHQVMVAKYIDQMVRPQLLFSFGTFFLGWYGQKSRVMTRTSVLLSNDLVWLFVLQRRQHRPLNQILLFQSKFVGYSLCIISLFDLSLCFIALHYLTFQCRRIDIIIKIKKRKKKCPQKVEKTTPNVS